MDISDLKHKSEKDLRALLAEKRAEWRKLCFQSSENQLKNVRALRLRRKEAAQILTLLNARGRQAS